MTTKTVAKKIRAMAVIIALIASFLLLSVGLGAAGASAQRVGCTFYSVKIHSSGVDDCFLPSPGPTETVYLPATTTVYTGAYGGMEVWYHECNNCNSGTMYYVRLPSSSNSYTLYYGFGVTVVQFKYN